MYKNDINSLKKLEDRDDEVKKKTKNNFKIDKKDIFYRAKLFYNLTSCVCKTNKFDNLKKGDKIIISTSYGGEFGIVQGRILNMEDVLLQDTISDIDRLPTKWDKDKFESNQKKSQSAYYITQDKIREHRLKMKLINVHYFLEDSKILFNFTADGRVDFRYLVKDLAAVFKTRIELRQIGVRDECRIIDGFGQCGKHFCCSNVNNEFTPITIKMAKEQNITLNSQKISGACGRLLCCLAYEYDTYLQEKKNYPPEGVKIKVNNEMFVIAEINIQTKIAKLVSISEENSRYCFIPISRIKYNSFKRTGYVQGEVEF